jgi:type II secretory pathway component GspD/PulD (secretin)
MGLAFLSDIQVFLFMEAAQSDRRTNVMQAPKVTLFNGQTSTVSVIEQAPYVANVAVINVNGQVIFQPQIQPLGTGVNLTLQAVISADRRFVRMSINPTFTAIAVPGPPNLFPVTVPVFPVQGVPGQGPNPIVFTQYIQQQATQSITVGTTVAVPDGGTVVMGGLKTVSESRSEYGPPVLSKIPYINRLFKNVAYGRESSSLLIMVTPRIIIMEEEEEYQTGYRAPNVSAQGP